MCLLGIQLWIFIRRHHCAVDAHAHESFALDGFDDLHVLTFATLHNGCEQENLFALGHVGDGFDNLAGGLLAQFLSTDGAVHLAHFCPEQTHVVINLGHRSHRRTRVTRGRLLIDRNSRGETFNALDFGLFHLRNELTCVGRKTFHVPALTFCENGIEGERRFSRTRKSRDNRQFIAWDLHINVLEVMHLGAFDDDLIHTVTGESRALPSKNAHTKNGPPCGAAAKALAYAKNHLLSRVKVTKWRETTCVSLAMGLTREDGCSECYPSQRETQETAKG